MTRKTINQLHDAMYSDDAEYAKAYDALSEEFSIADEMIRARKHADLTQKELAERMGTTQTQIARMEGGHLPSTRTLERLAAATGTKLKIRFEPTHR